MSKFSLSGVAKSVWTATKKHSPEILTGIGIAGMFTAGIMAVRATPKALMLIGDAEHDEETDIYTELKPIEKVKVAWKCYIPAVIISGVSTACLIGASSVNLRRNAALATAYTLSESVLKEYQEKVVETIGEKKERAVRDTVAKEKVEKNPPVEQEIILTEKGNTLMYDAISGRYFRGDIDKIKKIENLLNKRLLQDDYISLNDFYYEVGLPTIKMGDGLGWCIDKGMIEFNLSATLTAEDKQCIVIDYRLAPEYGYKG